MDILDQVGAVLFIAFVFFALQAGLGIFLSLAVYGKNSSKISRWISGGYIATMTSVCALLCYAAFGWVGAIGVLSGTAGMFVLIGLDRLFESMKTRSNDRT